MHMPLEGADLTAYFYDVLRLCRLQPGEKALIFSEPTLSGARDLERALDTCRHLHVHALVSINKADINPRLADTIAEGCEELGVPMLPRIPYDEVVSNAVRQGRAITEYGANLVADAIRRIWDELQQRLAAG